MKSDIVKILKGGDKNEVLDALTEVHRRKAAVLAASEYSPGGLKAAAKLHAYHLALASVILPDVEIGEEGVTGLDYHLAKLFRDCAKRCEKIATKGDEFYGVVVEELNELISSLCG
ncbi:MAG: hypothetical protein ACK4M3_00680 [Pyrobaculum sp.]